MCLNQVDSLLTSLSSRTYKHAYSNEDDPIVIDDSSENSVVNNTNNYGSSSSSSTGGGFLVNLHSNAANSKNIFNYVKGSNSSNSYEQIGTASSYRYVNTNGQVNVNAARLNGNGVSMPSRVNSNASSFRMHLNHMSHCNVATNRNLEFI